MKKIVLLAFVALALCSVSSLYAQPPQGDPAARAAQMKEKLKSDLKLTDVQADSVLAIQQEFTPRRRELFQDQSLSQDDKMAKMKDLSDQSDKRINKVLGDDLFKQYKDWYQKNRPQRMGPPPQTN